MATLIGRRKESFLPAAAPLAGASLATFALAVVALSVLRGEALGIALGLGLLADRGARSPGFLSAPSSAVLAGIAPAAPGAAAALSLLFAFGRASDPAARCAGRAVADATAVGAAGLVGSLFVSAPVGGLVAFVAAYGLELAGEAVAPVVSRRWDPFDAREIVHDAGAGLWPKAVLAVVAAGVVRHGSAATLLAAALPLGYLASAERARARRRRDRAAMIQALSGMLQYAHPYTLGHMQRVGELADRVGERLGLGPRHRRKLAEAALLHDVGKIAVDEEILEAERKLEDEEMALVRLHAAYGGEIVAASDVRDPAIAWVRHHHERMDGRGYPDGLVGEEIPIESRIIAVIDAYDAMIGTGAEGARRYRRALSSSDARLELRRCAGTQFDEIVVEAFERVLEAEPL